VPLADADALSRIVGPPMLGTGALLSLGGHLLAGLVAAFAGIVAVLEH